MKVALLSRAVFPNHGFGGLERHVAALRRHLELAGCDVRLFTTPAPGLENADIVPYRTIPWPQRAGFVVLDRNTNYVMWSVRAARKLLASYEPDVVQADGGAGFGYAYARDGSSAPLILHPHGMEEFKTTSTLKQAAYTPLKRAIRFTAERSARVIAPDRSMAPEVEEHLGVSPDKIAVVPNALDLDAFAGQRAEVKELGIDPDALVLLSVGRLEENKGFTDLAKALGSIRDEMPDAWQWHVVGEGPERSRIEREVDAHGLAACTKLLGSVSDEELHALYERANLFVHPTRYEGSSMVTLEAMAHRKPVIATRVGGIPDKIEDGISGLLVPPGDVEALARAISAAVSEPELLAEWGVEARRVVDESFSWRKRVHELIALYEDVVSAPAT